MDLLWDSRYSVDDYIYGTQPNTWFRQAIAGHAPGRLLVPGAGEGRDAVFAAALGWQVTAFDQSSMARLKALKLAKEKGVSIDYRVANVQEFNYQDKFDMVGLIYLHLLPAERRSFHQHLGSMLNGGARVVLEAFNPKQLDRNSGGPKDKNLLMDSAALAKDFDYLKILVNKELCIELNEGTYHQGEAEVVRFLGEFPY